jgi:hypothetical protein
MKASLQDDRISVVELKNDRLSPKRRRFTFLVSSSSFFGNRESHLQKKKKEEMLLAYTISVQSGQNRDQMVSHKSQVNHASLNPRHAFKVCIKTHHQ